MRIAKRPRETESTEGCTSPCKLRKLHPTENKIIEISASSACASGNNGDINLRSSENTCEEIKSTSADQLNSNANFFNENAEFASTFDGEIRQILNDLVVPDEEAQDILSKVMHDLNIAAKSIKFPHELLPFGSYVSGLMCKGSDIDICFNPLSNAADFKPSLNSLSKIFRKTRLFSQVICIKAARVPIIQLIHKATNISCDLSFSNESGVRNTLLMKFYLSLNTNLKPLILFLKHLLKKHDLKGPGRITTYMLFWLTVYYMQQKDLLPPVMNARHLTDERVFLSGWDCSVPKYFTVPVTDKYSLFFHVKEFLKFYSDFEFTKFVISPYLACAIPTDCFENLRIPSDTFSLYLEKLEKQNDVKFSLGLINVQDPSMHNLNITKSMEEPSLNKFKVLCDRTYKYLSEDVNNQKANYILRNTLSLVLPHKHNPPGNCIQYMTILWEVNKLPQRILSMYEQQRITYLSDSLRTILETKLKFNVEIIFADEVERMCRKDDKLQKVVAPLCFLKCSTKEQIKGEQNVQFEKQAKLWNTFIILELPNPGKHIRIYAEGGARDMCFLKHNLRDFFIKLDKDEL